MVTVVMVEVVEVGGRLVLMWGQDQEGFLIAKWLSWMIAMARAGWLLSTVKMVSALYRLGS
jgi:hypothetical protein